MSKLSIALLVGIFLLGSATLFGNNIFQAADSFNTALDKANTNRKLLLTYAASSTAPCCIAMEKATFQNLEIQNLLKSSFYPIKINLSNDLGKQWASKFQIINSPTLLFFDTNGTLIKQVENGVSSSELKSILKEVVYYNTNGFWPLEGEPVVLTATIINKPSSNPTFSILVDQIPTDDPSIRDIVQKIKLTYPNELLQIKLGRLGEKTFYRLLLGKFYVSKEAEVLLKNIKETGFKNAHVLYTQDQNH